MESATPSSELAPSPLEATLWTLERLIGDLLDMASLNVEVTVSGQLSNTSENGYVMVSRGYANVVSFSAIDIQRRAEEAQEGLDKALEAMGEVRAVLQASASAKAAS